jgi:hypothetical protein
MGEKFRETNCASRKKSCFVSYKNNETCGTGRFAKSKISENNQFVSQNNKTRFVSNFSKYETKWVSLAQWLSNIYFFISIKSREIFPLNKKTSTQILSPARIMFSTDNMVFINSESLDIGKPCLNPEIEDLVAGSESYFRSKDSGIVHYKGAWFISSSFLNMMKTC